MFKNLFISYKIELKKLGKPIPFHKNSLCMKILILLIIICFPVGGILAIFIQNLFLKSLAIFPALLGIILLIIYHYNTLNYRLEEYFIPYNKKRRDMIIDILKKYNINTENLDSIDMLIEEAKFAQMESDVFEEFKEPFKRYRGLIVFLLGTFSGKIMDNFTFTQIIIMAKLSIALILIIYSLDFFYGYIFKKIFYSDYYKYNEFIRDLREIKIFYIEQKKE